MNSASTHRRRKLLRAEGEQSVADSAAAAGVGHSSSQDGHPSPSTRKYPCHICSKVFTRSFNRRRHIEKKHKTVSASSPHQLPLRENESGFNDSNLPAQAGSSTIVSDQGNANSNPRTTASENHHLADEAPADGMDGTGIEQNGLDNSRRPGSNLLDEVLTEVSESEQDNAPQDIPCDRPDLIIERGQPASNKEKDMDHMVSCPQCWRKIAPGMYSQNYLDELAIVASRAQSRRALQHLISTGAKVSYVKTNNVDIIDSIEHSGATALHFAAGHRTPSLKLLEIICANGPLINYATHQLGYTALLLACEVPCQDDGSLAILPKEFYIFILKLLENGADANICDRDLWLPLHLFLQTHGEITEIESDLFRKTLKQLIDKTFVLNHQNNKGDTALHLATASCEPAVEYLLQKGASPSIKNEHGIIPLHKVRSMGTFSLLVDHCPDTLTVRCFDGMNALHHALAAGRFDIADVIINQKKDLVTSVDGDNDTCLHLVFNLIESGRKTKIVDSLLKNGCNPNVKGGYGDTCLHSFARYYVEKIKNATQPSTTLADDFKYILGALKEHNADLNQANDNEETPLAILGKAYTKAYVELNEGVESQHNLFSTEKSASVDKTSLESSREKVAKLFNKYFLFSELTGILRAAGGEVTEEEGRHLYQSRQDIHLKDACGTILETYFPTPFEKFVTIAPRNDKIAEEPKKCFSGINSCPCEAAKELRGSHFQRSKSYPR